MMNLTLLFLMMVLPGLCAAAVSEKITVGPKAVQSSTHNYLANAANAIDGNRSSNYFHGSCTHTTTEKNPWWRVQFSRPHYITSVTITNRGDCCHERIEGAEIRIGNNEENNGNNNQLVGTVRSLRLGETKSFTFSPVLGRFVNIVIPGDMKILSLCEVEVYTDNIAVGPKAVQSSTHSYKLAQAPNAIDGNHNSDYTSGSCTHTESEKNPWWRVEFSTPHYITSVTITNRGDCCHEQIEGAEIRIGNDKQNNGNNNQLVGIVRSLGLGETKLFAFKPVVGRFVNIVIPGDMKILTLCEVEVYTADPELACACST